MQYHEVANLFPMMGDLELQELAADIKANGLIDAIWTYEGRIIDGRNRYQACKLASEEPRFQEWRGGTYAELVAFVVGLNVKRRHLTSSQRAAVSLDVEEMLADEAAKRRNANLMIGQTNPVVQKFEQREKGRASEQAAEITGTNRQYVSDAKKIQAQAPEVLESVRAGTVNIPQAKRIAALPQEQRTEVLERVEAGEKPQAAIIAIRQADVAEQRKQDIATRAQYQPTITLADAVQWLEAQSPCDLLITDPPYMTDVEDITAFARHWLPAALGKVKPTGRAYVCIGPYPQELNAYLSIAPPDHLILANVLVWTYRNTLGPSPKMMYKNNWQAILYYHGVDAPPLQCPIMTEQFSVQDISAPDGRQGNRYHAWQKPDQLAIRLISHSTRKDDLVLDPFSGTGTFLLAASELSRTARGCDTSQDMLDIATKRGCKHV